MPSIFAMPSRAERSRSSRDVKASGSEKDGLAVLRMNGRQGGMPFEHPFKASHSSLPSWPASSSPQSQVLQWAYDSVLGSHI